MSSDDFMPCVFSRERYCKRFLTPHRVGVNIAEVSHIEFNEAFTAQVLASNKI